LVREARLRRLRPRGSNALQHGGAQAQRVRGSVRDAVGIRTVKHLLHKRLGGGGGGCGGGSVVGPALEVSRSI
jgi:hypothetical protein